MLTRLTTLLATSARCTCPPSKLCPGDDTLHLEVSYIVFFDFVRGRSKFLATTNDFVEV